MNTQGIFIAHPKTVEQVNALRAFMQALKITFEVSKEESYNPEFVEKILESRQQAREGKLTRVAKENLKEFLGV
jgi:adenylate kinase family enzyme